MGRKHKRFKRPACEPPGPATDQAADHYLQITISGLLRPSCQPLSSSDPSGFEHWCGFAGHAPGGRAGAVFHDNWQCPSSERCLGQLAVAVVLRPHNPCRGVRPFGQVRPHAGHGPCPAGSRRPCGRVRERRAAPLRTDTAGNRSSFFPKGCQRRADGACQKSRAMNRATKTTRSITSVSKITTITQSIFNTDKRGKSRPIDRPDPTDFLSLPLLMAGVCADNNHHATTADDLALITHTTDASANFHEQVRGDGRPRL